PRVESKKVKAPFEALVAKLAAGDLAASSEAVKQLAESLVQVLTVGSRAAASAIEELERQSELRREETDVLCWLTAGVSRDLGAAFSALKTLPASVVAGKE